MSWYWIALIVIAGCAVINPILYFIKWELYNRKEWIEDKNRWRSDDRFWDYESSWETDTDGLQKQVLKKIQIAEIRPQIRDVWNSKDYFWVWWFPVANVITTCYYLGCIIARPFEKSWKWIVRKIANIKV